MSELQRTRIVRAALDELAARGYEEITAAQIAARAGVSRKTFYEHFEERDGALVAALEEARSRRSGLNGDVSGPHRSDEMPEFRRTYRTMRVIQAIGGLGARGSGASNREVGEHAAIADSGQIARMLGRLEGLGLIENSVLWPRRGEANSWRLTDWGDAVWEVIKARPPAAGGEGDG
jgi:AcrR family transcriptional regulator